MPPEPQLVKGPEVPAAGTLLRFTHDERGPRLAWRVALAAAIVSALCGWLLLSEPSFRILAFVVAAGCLVLAAARGWSQLQRRSVAYALGGDRLEIERGLFSRRHESVELWSVRDVALDQSPLDRLVDSGTITVVSSDPTHPSLVIGPVARAQTTYAAVRDAVLAARQRQRVVALDK
jgi:uncharacterized membrane protein YdbT with pleckstrin-like domain